MPFGIGVVTDAGYIASSTLHAGALTALGSVDIAVMVALALWQRNASDSITDMQDDVADQQMQLAEKLHAHAKLFWAEETRLVNDVFGEARAPTEYAGLGAGWQTIAATGMEQSRQIWLHEANRMCAPGDACLDARWLRGAATQAADIVTFAARQAEARAQTQRDRRYEQQYRVLALGQGVLSLTVKAQEALLSVAGVGVEGMSGMINEVTRTAGNWLSYWEASREDQQRPVENTARRWNGYVVGGSQ